MLTTSLALTVQASTVGQAVVAALSALRAIEGDTGCPWSELVISLPVRVSMCEDLWLVSMAGQVRPQTRQDVTVVVAGMGGTPDIPELCRKGLESARPAIRRVA